MRNCAASSTVSLNASEGEWPFSGRTLYLTRNIPCVKREEISKNPGEPRRRQTYKYHPLTWWAMVSSAVAFSLALPKASCHKATEELMPPPSLKNVRMVRPEPLGATRMKLTSFGGTISVSSLFTTEKTCEKSCPFGDERPGCESANGKGPARVRPAAGPANPGQVRSVYYDEHS
jgi:hypothetical protein